MAIFQMIVITNRYQRSIDNCTFKQPNPQIRTVLFYQKNVEQLS